MCSRRVGLHFVAILRRRPNIHWYQRRHLHGRGGRGPASSLWSHVSVVGALRHRLGPCAVRPARGPRVQASHVPRVTRHLQVISGLVRELEWHYPAVSGLSGIVALGLTCEHAIQHITFSQDILKYRLGSICL